MTCLILGCKSVSHESSLSSIPSNLVNAKKSFASGDLYFAKRQTEAFLKNNPSSSEAQQLMAEILSEEIALHKEAFEEAVNDDFSPEDDKKAQIKTWLERGRSLLELGEYDEATRAAEHIFTLDPENAQASKLLDQIKERAWVAGKKEIMDGQEVVRAEMDDRALIYRKQAKAYLAAGQVGAAKLTAEKLLLLYPEDEEGLEILDQIKSRQNSATLTRS